MNAMRIIAALLVVLNHMRPLFFVDFSDAATQNAFTVAAYGLTALGHQAVVVFFVLSGYWVGGSALQGFRAGNFDAFAYSVARVVRLWIVLLPAILLTQLLDRVGTALWSDSDIYAGSPAYHTVVPVDGAVNQLDPLTTLANVFFVMDVHASTVGTNSPLWSLAAEFWYYLLFPALLLLVWRRVSLRGRLIAGIVVALALMTLLLPSYSGSTNVLALFPAWLAGAAIAAARQPIEAFQRRMRPPALGAVRSLLLVAVVVAAVLDSQRSSIPTVYLLAVLTALLVASLITDVQSRTGRALLAPLSWSAEWSYSLYAIHMPVLAVLAAATVPAAEGRWQLTPSTALLGMLVTVVPILAAMAFYFVFERNTKPVVALVKNRVRRRTGLEGGRRSRATDAGRAQAVPTRTAE